MIAGKRVLVIEDGPSLTHGGMPFGAGYLMVQQHQARAIVDPRPSAIGSLHAAFQQYPHIGPVLPAMGYGPQQIRDLEDNHSIGGLRPRGDCHADGLAAVDPD